MNVAPITGRPLFAWAIAIAGCLGCSDGTDGSGGSGGEGGSGGTSRQAGAGSGASGASGGGATAGRAGGGGGGAGADGGGGTSAGTDDFSLDPTFGEEGVALLDRGSDELIASVTIQPSGSIVVAGMVDNQAFVGRFTAEGLLDSSFGDMGLTVPELGGTSSIFSKVGQQGDGKLIAAGQSLSPMGNIVVARFSAEGQLDTTFGTDGVTTIDAGGRDSGAELLVLPDDTLLIGGELSHAGTGSDFAVVHLLSDGTPDPDFGSAGLSFAHNDQDENLLAMGRDGQGRIVVSGTVAPDGTPGSRSLAFARFTAEGILDSSFGDDGWTVIPRTGDTGDAMQTLVILDDGDILATGDIDGELALIRLTSTGELDASFGAAGRARAGLSGMGQVLILESGSTLVVGTHDELGAVVRFTEAGALDPSLAGTGFQTYDLGIEGSVTLFAAALLEDGRLVASGAVYGEVPAPPPPVDGVLIRLELR
jgi:uncharacterized delta-60 repeat protein